MTRYVLTFAGLVTVAGSAAPARAQSPADIRKQADASVDRNIIFPSAETINGGDLTFNDYEILFVGLTYGITDDLQLSATTLLPVVEEIPLVAAVSAKYRLIARDHLVFSIQPGVNVIHDDGDTFGTFGFQLLLDYVVDQDGDLVLSLAESTQFGFGSFEFGESGVADGAVLTFGVGASWRVAEIVKLLAELVFPTVVSWADIGDSFYILEEAFLFNYGVRFFGESIAVDLTFLRPLHPDASESFVMGIPYLAFSARF